VDSVVARNSIREEGAMSRCLQIKYFVTVVLCCLATVWPTNVIAEDRKNVEDDLRRALQHNILSLRNPYFGRMLRFDSSGNLVGKADAGPWSTCGLLEVEKLKLAPDHLEIDGKRIVLALRSRAADKQQPSVQNTAVVTDERVRIFVDMSAMEVAQVKQILSYVFQGGRLEERIATYWKPNTNDMKAFHLNTPNAIIAELEGNRPVYLVNPGVVDAPKPTYTPDPTYTENARRDKLQGTAILVVAVNEKGFPEVLEIAQSLGEGLDTHALAAVAQWRFQPAMKNGQPVAVLINVQVRFHLY
jgi:TonB family protein